MIFEIPFKTPTINHLYGQRGIRKYLKKEAVELRSKIKNIVMAKELNEKLSGPLDVTVFIYEDWYTKKGDVKKKDISNREKFLIDSIFMALPFDDKMIFKQTMVKAQSETDEKAMIEIRSYNG